jgi:glutamate/tyrosine decarboxylase-like PLP-dependent enzyme
VTFCGLPHQTRAVTDEPSHSAWDPALAVAVEHAAGYLAGLPERPVSAGQESVDELRKALAVPLPDAPLDAAEVVRDLADAAEPGLVATGSPRYFGFVIGGALPAALAADWLAATWDQNAGLYVGGPSAAVVEEVAGSWVLNLLGLPASASFGFVTGGQMANLTALAAARHAVLARQGWDVETRGLAGAPPIRVLASDIRHATIDRALRFLGLGTDAVTVVPSGPDARLRVDALADALEGHAGANAGPAPAIVCAQAGEVNSGAIDPLAEICEVAHAAGAWVHVDGAFGLWAGASPALRPALAGVERADSWATDFHKWLNVPYDSGFVVCADPDAHRGAMSARAAYLVHADEGAGAPRDQMEWNPEFSRRARGFAVYAALRSLGRHGVADLVERCCARARQFAERLGRIDGVEVLNDVTLDQVLVRFHTGSADGDGPADNDPADHDAADHDAAEDAVAEDDALTGRVVDAVQASGDCWMSGTTWRGHAAMRISVVNWQTTDADVDRSVAAIESALAHSLRP